MKKILFLLFALFPVTVLLAQKPIIINGKIDNYPNRDRSYIEKRWFNPETLKEETV